MNGNTNNTDMSFKNFALLPAELRSMIWSYLLPDENPRVIEMVAYTVHQESLTENESRKRYGYIIWREPDLGMVRTTWDDVHALPQSFPTLMHVNTEARILAQKAYGSNCINIPSARGRSYNERKICSKLGYNNWPRQLNSPGLRVQIGNPSGNAFRHVNRSLRMGTGTLFNPGKDILFLTSPPKQTSKEHAGVPKASARDLEPVLSHVDTLVRWLNPKIVTQIRFLAMSWDTWNDSLRTKTRLSDFTNLEGLWICLQGDDASARRSRPGDSALQRLQLGLETIPNFLGRQIKEELKFLNLGSSNENFNPKLKVVANKADLARLFSEY